ncbi:carotenoid biosynthesis protein [Sphingomonas sp. PAMC 26605]|uniref:carotenoid biosynthesis protein n=1 Tax=Sphingomonas sp. PAMC 26605 TaxID=1112214 RepID=UPI0002E3C28A|nr:carotenoid biosynthesis protein [Sphingomonas sp. PAMC 26605]
MWVSLLLLPAIFYQGARTGPLAQGVAGLSIAFLAVHAVIVLGAPRAAMFAGISLAVTFAIENIGTATGVPYGHYAFLVGSTLIHIGAIPIIVGPLYCAFGYQAWIIACLLVGADINGPRDRLSLIAVPVVAAFTITQWDVVMDPPSATIGHAWIWFDGGGYFGVPLSNFLGWFLTTWIFLQLFALATYRLRDRHPRGPSASYFLVFPILTYMASGLSHLMPLLDPDMRVLDGAGRAWSSADIRTSAAVIALFTMLPTSLLALIRLAQQRAAVGDDG